VVPVVHCAGTLYRNFPDRQALLHAVELDVLVRTIDAGNAAFAGSATVVLGLTSALFAVEERGDGFVDPSLSGFGCLCRVDRIDVVSLQAVRQSSERGSGGRRLGERCFEVGWDLDFSGAVGERERHMNGVAAAQAGFLANGRALHGREDHDSDLGCRSVAHDLDQTGGVMDVDREVESRRSTTGR
jgi:AcrR family transcriptional regulator